MREIRFLVADDSRVVRASVRAVLEHAIGSKEIVEAADGLEALKALQTQKIDMIISDWNMPNLNGEELLYNVRNSREWSDIPFIMMTAHGGRDYLITAIQNGVNGYITKPFTPAELQDKISKSWNSATRRKSERYNMLPDHELIIRHGSTALKGQVMNISRTGVLVRLNHDERLSLFRTYAISIDIMKGENDFMTISPLHAIAVRLEAEGNLHLTDQVCLMALNFIPSMTSGAVEKTLDEMLKYLCSMNPDIIRDE
jgi:two-component system, chemotaxis family, chemotaxis protein CheY